MNSGQIVIRSGRMIANKCFCLINSSILVRNQELHRVLGLLIQCIVLIQPMISIEIADIVT